MKVREVMGITAGTIATIILAGGMSITQKGLDETAPRPKAPVIIDVNGDGIPDKVLERLVSERTGGFVFYRIETEILYGIG